MQSYDAAPISGGSSAPSWAYSTDARTYALLYQTQPNVRKCVDFLARNVAQLGLHVFRRVSDTDRERLTTHQLAQWIAQPTPYVTRYRLIESLMADLGIYFNAYWLKVRDGDRIGLQRVPPEQMQVAGGLVPSLYHWTVADGTVYKIAPSEIVHFTGYNPLNPLIGLSPLETLRRILAEDIASMQHRESFWRNAARIEGIVERPPTAKVWNPEQAESFRAQWRKFSGEAGAGSVPVLQEGATFKSIAFSPRQAEYTTARKLTGEEVAAAYHIPLPMVGILEHATFSNVKEQHKQLYQDSLGPWLEMIAAEIERQVLPECRDTVNVYVEFNIAAKLSGSFEEQAAALQVLVGRPVMTANEGRARLNLPSMDEPGADQLIRPLNTAPETLDDDAVPPPAPAPAVAPDARAMGDVIEAMWRRQAAALRKVNPEDRAAAFDVDRWTRELASDLRPLLEAAEYADFDERAARIAGLVNADTHTRLTRGDAPFARSREATSYVA